MTLLAAFVNEQRLRGLARRTVERRVWSVNNFAEFVAARGRTLTTALPVDAEQWLLRFKDAQTRSSLRSDLRMLYQCAVRRQLVDVDITIDIPGVRVPRRGATPLGDGEVAAVYAIANREQRLMVMLAAYAGLRVSEIAAIRGSDLMVRERLVVVRSGKGDKDAVLPMADDLARELDDWRLTGARVFGTMNGSMVHYRIKRAMRFAGVEGRPHDLRHTYGTAIARRTNGNMVITQLLMRHESLSSTQRYVKWHTIDADVVSGLHAA